LIHKGFAVIAAKGIEPLKEVLIKEPEDHINSVSAWSLEQIGKDLRVHAKKTR
jgi:hypothetical protein